ncbi:MAG: polysaccharide biosynthesis/export family protein [Porphyromonadaceae bacterium]|nr:polysaccharide biosynthesis/export family protein [Porphyromonadaceae bacterium]
MKINRILIFIFLSVNLISGSCVSRKGLTYLRYSNKTVDHETISEQTTSVTPAAYKIMPYDNLYIRVITPDPQWSELFNIMPAGQGGTFTEESAALFGYSVDKYGKIEIPYVGIVEVANKTLSEIKSELDILFKNYLTDAAITVKLVNNYISILGEVEAPGRYRLTKDRLNVFEALSMAGDMTDFGNRQRVQLIRPSPYGPNIKEFTLSDRSILSSDFFYVMPNDVIYVIPARGKIFQVNSTLYTLFFTTLTSALAVIAFFRTL